AGKGVGAPWGGSGGTPRRLEAMQAVRPEGDLPQELRPVCRVGETRLVRDGSVADLDRRPARRVSLEVRRVELDPADRARPAEPKDRPVVPWAAPPARLPAV